MGWYTMSVFIFQHSADNRLQHMEITENANGTQIGIGVCNLDRFDPGNAKIWIDRRTAEELWMSLGAWLGRR